MPRVQLTEQPVYAFRYLVTVEVTDLNYGGHLANDALVGLLAQARTHLLRELGCSEPDLGDGHTGLILPDLAVSFRQEAFLFDELAIDSQIGEMTERSLRIFHRVRRGEDVVALAETGVIAFDYTARQVAPIPAAFRRALDARLHQP